MLGVDISIARIPGKSAARAGGVTTCRASVVPVSRYQ